ncbi:MAG: addiction module toxin, HicA family [Chloroflexota bacterium]|nr:MAG: addiction module toxin, HicA family [Chloroflexota bacterium]
MPKTPILKPKQVARALERAGFILDRQKGSHAQYKKGILLVTVPLHNEELAPKTLRSILRQANMTIEELKALL